MNEEKFQALYKNTKKEEIIKELYFKCKANYELENIIKEVREYIENNWISQKDADIHRFDNEELEIEIGDIAVILEILNKEVNND